MVPLNLLILKGILGYINIDLKLLISILYFEEDLEVNIQITIRYFLI